MATVILQIKPDSPDQEFSSSLDGRTYVFRFRWNIVAGAWFMTVSDVDEVPIVAGVRVVVERPLGARCVDSRRWPGVLVALDTSGKQAEAGEKDLGDRVQVYYVEKADLPGVV